jgi:diacylglycerol kinase (ATP)
MIGELEARNFALTVRETRGPGDAEAIARVAASQGFDTVLAAGGDGTVNEILNGLSENPLPFGVYPLGTANVLAAEIGMPTHPVAFARIFATSQPRPIWIGEVSCRRFALMLSVGFDARVVAGVNVAIKRRMGKVAYVAAAWTALLRHRRVQFRVVIDGVSHLAAAAIVAKSRYYGGRFTVAPDSRITDPAFRVCLLPGNTTLDIVRYAAALARGNLSELADVRVIKASVVTIDGDPEEVVQVDGDIVGRLPVVTRIAPTPVMLMMSERDPQGS